MTWCSLFHNINISAKNAYIYYLIIIVLLVVGYRYKYLTQIHVGIIISILIILYLFLSYMCKHQEGFIDNQLWLRKDMTKNWENETYGSIYDSDDLFTGYPFYDNAY
jgi:hypothetical protein